MKPRIEKTRPAAYLEGKMKLLKIFFILILLSSNSFFFRGSVHSTEDIAALDSSDLPLEGHPRCIALNPLTDQVVVGSATPNHLSIIDLNTQEISSKMSLGKSPIAIGIDNELNLAVVSSCRSNFLTVIDIDTSQILSTIPAGKSPSGIAINGVTHTGLVSNSRGNSVMVIDLATFTILNTIPVGKRPRGIAVDPGLNLALVVNTGGNNVSVIDLESYKVTGQVPVGKMPTAISINPETHLAAVVSQRDNSIAVIDLQSWQTKHIPLDKHPTSITINPLDNRAVAICDRGRNLLLIDLDQHTVLERYNFRRLFKGVAVNPFTNIAVAVDDKTDALTLLQLPNPIPEISSLTPAAVPRGSKGAMILIEGSGFIKTSVASLLPGAPLPVDFIDNHHLEVTIPERLLTGPGTYQIVVTNPAPDGGSSNPIDFQINNPVPSISALEPTETSAGQIGLTLTIHGSGFFKETIISIKGNPRTFTLPDQSKVEISITAEDLEMAGYIEIVAFNPPPGGGRSNVSNFIVSNPIPSLATISPSSITAGSSSFTLTLTGDNFVRTSVVSYNNQHFLPNYISKKHLEVTIPPDSIMTPGGYPVKVTNPPPGGGESSELTFTANPQRPPVDPQPEGSFGEKYQDLILTDVRIQSYDPKRFSLITGLVQNLDGSPINDVSVNILGHSEYGTAKTNAEGRFSIPVEGGGALTVTYQKEGLLTAHRNVYVPWNDIAITETIVMVPQDTKSTTLTFDGNPNTVVTHQSTTVTDDRGSRSSTLVLSGDNRVYSIDAWGNVIQELTTITTRATEFTSEQSMPAKLPPNSAYTYCAEFGVDGVHRARFDKPVMAWVNNFLGFNVGESVPAGYYDRDKGVWVPSDNGLVVRLLDTNSDGIVDALDADGDNQPDDLNDDGTFSDEVSGLSDPHRYPPGSTFWRITVTHFTPWDYNWPYGFPAGATAPNPQGIPVADLQREEVRACKLPTSSYVEQRSRIFHEDIPIPGTDFALHYTSSRVKGYIHKITVPASGETIPESLKQILVKAQVAGRSFIQVLPPLANQKTEFIWDGLDYLGRVLNGGATAHISVGFVYDGVYYSAGNFSQSFAQAGTEVMDIRARNEVISWMRTEVKLPARTSGVIAEGWSISNHHHFNPTDPTRLYKGDGTIIENSLNLITTVAGTGVSGSGGDGGPATEAKISYPRGVAIDASGNLYIADYGNSAVRRIDTKGIITTVAWVDRPEGVAVDGSGNIYVSEYLKCRIRKVDTNGTITTVAGNGIQGYSGDGGPAIEAKLNQPSGVTVDTSGNLYITDTVNQRIRKVDTNGIITTVAGNGIPGYGGDGGAAIQGKLHYPYGVAVDASGNLYIADMSNQRIRKVDVAGIITTLAGNGDYGYGGDGGPAAEAKLFQPTGVGIDAMGNLYIGDSTNSRIRKVDTNGIITTIAGNGTQGYGGDEGPATEAKFNYPGAVCTDTAGHPYISDGSNSRIRKVAPPSAFVPFFNSGDIPFAEESGLGHILTSAGRHKTTIDLDTGILLYKFGYDQNNKLISITDRFGNVTIINRKGDGIPTSVTSPDGITTSLTIDPNNHLIQITDPDGNYYSFEYTPSGLMTAKIEPEGNRFEHVFDSIGRLTDAMDQEGGHWQFLKNIQNNGDILTRIRTGEGNLTTYSDHTESTGSYNSHILDPSGAETVFTTSSDRLSGRKSLPCGTVFDFKYGFDPQYKFKYLKESGEGAPSGLKKITFREKTYQDTNEDQTPDLITEKVTVNGKARTLETNALQLKRISTSPQGRKVTTFYNPTYLLTTKLMIPGLFDADFGYDSRGRLTSIKTNIRETTFTYDPLGNLYSVTDPEGQTMTYDYDPVGRITGVNRPDGTSVKFTYNKNGNMTVLTNPSSIDHGFGYNKVNLNSSYQKPLSGSYSYSYNRDRLPLQIDFPSGKQIKNVYDNDRVVQIQTPEGDIDLTYLCGSKVSSMTTDREVITYGYDGSLVTSETLSGTLNQALIYTYNDDFNLSRFTYASSSVDYMYDNDGLLTKAGNFTIIRNTGNGSPEVVTGGALNINRSFNGYDELESENFIVDDQSLNSWNLNRDKTGRIVSKTETVEGTTSNYIYSYDSMGRLLSVTEDGVLVEEYQYDLNGRRTYEINLLKGITGRAFTYSDEDHLMTAGDTSYQHDVDGFLRTKTQGPQVTRYSYSSRGELLRVEAPDGRVVEYINDPLGRRIAKRIDGVITEKFLWQSLTRLLAVYDGSDNLIMRFEYADSRMPVAMTKNGIIYYMGYDQVGSLKIVADALGNVVKRLDYDSFGNIINDTNPGFPVAFGFAGGLYDRDTGLVRFGFRDYDPDVGRWTAKDPIGFCGGDSDLYGYVANNPTNFTDPSGLIRPTIPGYWKYLRWLAPRLFCNMLKQRIEHAEEINSDCREIGQPEPYFIDPEAHKFLAWCYKLGYLK